jgi:hypothetical protein
VLLAVLILQRRGSGWLGEWAAANLSTAPGSLSASARWAAACSARSSSGFNPRHVLAPEFDGFLVIGAVLVVYGVADALDAYGLVAVFTAGVYFRRYEVGHEYNPSPAPRRDDRQALRRARRDRLLATLRSASQVPG